MPHIWMIGNNKCTEIVVKGEKLNHGSLAQAGFVLCTGDICSSPHATSLIHKNTAIIMSKPETLRMFL